MDADPTRAILIVTGASLRAEAVDRPLAYRLRERILRAADERAVAPGPEVVVCSDLWFVNDASLHESWAIALGSPEENALTALVESRVPVAFAIDGVLTVRLDLDFATRQACCWGVDALHTVNAVDALVERYLDLLLDRIVGASG